MAVEMGIADIPTNLGPSFLIRSFLPGFIASSLYYLTFYAAFRGSEANITAIIGDLANLFGSTGSNNSTTPFDVLLILSILAIILGMILSELDVQIYHLFEGLRFWPNVIRNWRYRIVLDRFHEIDEGLEAVKLRKRKIREQGENLCNEEEIRDLLCKESKLSGEAREYPFNPGKSHCKRYPDAATRLGNVIAEYEQYPEIQYGMHMMVFWQHLWLVLPADVKEDLDLRGAKVDFLVYLSFILLTYAFVSGAVFSKLGNYLMAFVCMVGSLSLSFLFYLASISSVKDYGRYIKAVFDLYRFDLAEKMGINISTKHLIPDDDELESWRRLRRYLLDYKK
jgi:hypothetical protein